MATNTHGFYINSKKVIKMETKQNILNVSIDGHIYTFPIELFVNNSEIIEFIKNQTTWANNVGTIDTTIKYKNLVVEYSNSNGITDGDYIDVTLKYNPLYVSSINSLFTDYTFKHIRIDNFDRTITNNDIINYIHTHITWTGNTGILDTSKWNNFFVGTSLLVTDATLTNGKEYIFTVTAKPLYTINGADKYEMNHIVQKKSFQYNYIPKNIVLHKELQNTNNFISYIKTLPNNQFYKALYEDGIQDSFHLTNDYETSLKQISGGQETICYWDEKDLLFYTFNTNTGSLIIQNEDLSIKETISFPPVSGFYEKMLYSTKKIGNIIYFWNSTDIEIVASLIILDLSLKTEKVIRQKSQGNIIYNLWDEKFYDISTDIRSEIGTISQIVINDDSYTYENGISFEISGGNQNISIMECFISEDLMILSQNNILRLVNIRTGKTIETYTIPGQSISIDYDDINSILVVLYNDGSNNHVMELEYGPRN